MRARERVEKHRRSPRFAPPETQVVNRASDGASLVHEAKSSPWRERGWLATALALQTATFLAYRPAWYGGLLWDDDGHITPPELRGMDGLWRIWFDVGATQQYYPLLHSFFWLFHRAWGDSTLGYHLASIFLHALSAWMVALILRRLQIPGSVLAAVVFALHPVHVESVAWLSELKNTLSGAFYLSAALCYIGFDSSRRPGTYAAALVLFVCALLSKTVTATLPVALLIVFWWQRGHVRWRRDILPLAPFFALAAVAGLMTVWVEQTLIGADKIGIALSIWDRIALAGRAVWFYAGKLVWPADLMFIYPKWNIDAGTLVQWLYPLALAALLVALWTLRRRWRAPLAATMYFVVTLAPALGFVDVFPFRYSYVADHFQYLASLGPIALIAGTVVTIVSTWWPHTTRIELIASASLALPLAAMTWAHSHDYRDAGQLYRATIAANPSAWLAHNNLGVLLQHEGRLDEARAAYDAALKIEPEAYEAHQNLAILLLQLARHEDVIRHADAALAIRPDNPAAYNARGSAQLRLGRADAAIASYREALRLRPEYPEAAANLGAALDASGSPDAAVSEYARVVALDPSATDARYRLADALRRAGRLPEAIREYREVLERDPSLVAARNDLGVALEAAGLFGEALAMFQQVRDQSPPSARIETVIGRLLMLTGQVQRAEQHFVTALKLEADYGAAHRNYADLLTRTGRAAAALEHYRTALRAQPDSPETRTNYGVALAQLGQYDAAAAQFREALRLRPDFALAQENLNALTRSSR